ncbi:hypothetical protein MPF19_17965 [Polaribacter sp. Z014]|uniref:hypothetical protein n=1 Tax=unclassified Polaribacter TaxID=196858 RepID=UPI0020203C10|nr:MULTISPECIES: hypothetical protein [unclassified Polaribacter]MCL7765312.1 hypothetical protein [Polaribacter sp. Z014]
MKKIVAIFSFLFLVSCQNFGSLKLISDLAKDLGEVSGTEVVANSNLIWMLNDSGNKPRIYGVSESGKIIKEITIKAKNNDWEDLTSDEEGNLYIGDFGNNDSKRKNLVILKVKQKDLNSSKKIEIEKIKFSYPNQTKFPPKKKQLFFDAESFFYYNNSFYIFTKSRVKNEFGKTSLYRIPAKEGKHEAVFISEFNNGNDMDSWITSADISKDGSKVALLSPAAVLIFTDYKNDDFLSGKLTKTPLNHLSQKEGIAFKNNSTLLITDEKAHGAGGNFYELKI